MSDRTEIAVAWNRVALFWIGGLSAVAIWALGENWDNPLISPAVFLALFSFVAIHASVSLALAGPIGPMRAILCALILSVPVTGLISLAALRFTHATELLDEPIMLSVTTMLVFLATPFLSVWMQDRQNVMKYSALFETAWLITIRYGVALCFVGVFWLVVFLSDTLLELVQISIVDTLLRTDWVRFFLSGAAFGLGLAVVYELRTTMSPFVVLRLLRLLVPIVLTVVGVFLIAIPIRGLTHLFGDFSAAATLMVTVLVSITLISAALDRDREFEVMHRGLRLATRGLAMVLPILAGLAGWAVWLRVTTYGWTPDRVLAAMVALFVLTYGLGYCAIAVFGHNWMRRIRALNVVLVVGVMAALVIWMTPLLDPYRIATHSQVNRFAQGHSTATQLPLWSMAHEWGRAGQAGLEDLSAIAQEREAEDLITRIAEAQTATSPFIFERSVVDLGRPDTLEEILSVMPTQPLGIGLPVDLIAKVPGYQLEQWARGCREHLGDGSPGCVFVQDVFMPGVPAQDQGMVLYLASGDLVRGKHVMARGEQSAVVRDLFDPMDDNWPELTRATLEAILAGHFIVAPSGKQALIVGGKVLAPAN